MRKCLVIHYSQTGQTSEALESLCSGLTNYDVEYLKIEEQEGFPFPWKITPFFRIFPRCILGNAARIAPLDFAKFQGDYDLVVVGYQVWFLSASLPMQALLKDQAFQKFAKGKPILAVVTCRNMWVSAVSKANRAFKSLGVGALCNHVLCDQSPPWANFVTTPRWLLTGKKGPFWFFPRAGIASESFQLSSALGKAINLGGLESVDIKDFSHRQGFSEVLMEKTGYIVFEAWARLIALCAPKENLLRDFMLVLFRLCLVVTILVLLPVASLVQLLTGSLFRKSLDRYINNLLKVPY